MHAVPPYDAEGPYYLSGAPFRESRVICTTDSASDDTMVTVTGRVLNSDCTGVVPNAVVDVWQASSTEDGAKYYGCSNGCSTSTTADGVYTCRGKVKADADGVFTFRTVRPGRYSARPVEHIHIKVWQEGETGAPHVTQFYFTDDAQSDGYNNEVRLTFGDGGAYGYVNIATDLPGTPTDMPPSPPPFGSDGFVAATAAAKTVGGGGVRNDNETAATNNNGTSGRASSPSSPPGGDPAPPSSSSPTAATTPDAATTTPDAAPAASAATSAPPLLSALVLLAVVLPGRSIV